MTREADPFTTRATWTAAVLGIAGGLYSYVDADGLSQRSTGTLDDRDEYRQYGAGLLAMGFGAALVGVIDSIRSSDSEYDDGIRTLRSTEQIDACREGPTARSRIQLRLPNGSTVAGILDERGEVDIPMVDVPDDSIPDDEAAITVQVGRRIESVLLSKGQWMHLRSNLEKNARSRLAADLREKRKTACATTIRTAEGRSPKEPLNPEAADVSAWADAKQTCKDLWTSELEEQSQDVARRFLFASCSARVSEVSGEVAAVDEASIDAVSSEIASIHSDCASHVEHLRPLAATILKFQAKLDKRAADEERRVAREVARQEARERADEARRSQAAERVRRQWASSRLVCNDGTLSPTCSCSRSNRRGCCSWHGGVSHCAGD